MKQDDIPCGISDPVKGRNGCCRCLLEPPSRRREEEPAPDPYSTCRRVASPVSALELMIAVSSYCATGLAVFGTGQRQSVSWGWNTLIVARRAKRNVH